MDKQNIYVHIPKTGGTSLINIFESNGIKIIDHDIRDPDYQSLSEYLKNLNSTNNNVFTFVRNPWDRVVSAFFYLINGGNNYFDNEDKLRFLKEYNGDFKLFVTKGFLKSSILEQIHFRPQYTWVSGGNILLCDRIYKYEDFNESVRLLSIELGLKINEVPHLNKSKHSYYRNYYCKKTREIIGEIYKEDIDLFGYEF